MIAARSEGEMVSCLYRGRVIHRRFTGPDHAINYAVHTLWLDIDEAPELDRRHRLFAYNRAGVFSFQDRDHGPRDGTPARVWITDLLASSGIDIAGGAIRVLCFPRALGMVFNPLSTWFAFGPGGDLRAIVYEVANTFGGWHTYVARIGANEAGAPFLRHGARKEFHVSPFFDRHGHYDFRTAVPGEQMNSIIRYGSGLERRMVAIYTGTRVPITNATLWSMLRETGHLTLKVLGGIHWEALKLWRKGARFHRDPDDPKGRVTIAGDVPPDMAGDLAGDGVGRGTRA